jgi:hypothetical protein
MREHQHIAALHMTGEKIIPRSARGGLQIAFGIDTHGLNSDRYP